MAGYCIIPGCKNAGIFDGYCDEHMNERFEQLLGIVRRYTKLCVAATQEAVFYACHQHPIKMQYKWGNRSSARRSALESDFHNLLLSKGFIGDQPKEGE
jgi:hypothetical protein